MNANLNTKAIHLNAHNRTRYAHTFLSLKYELKKKNVLKIRFSKKFLQNFVTEAKRKIGLKFFRSRRLISFLSSKLAVTSPAKNVDKNLQVIENEIEKNIGEGFTEKPQQQNDLGMKELV